MAAPADERALCERAASLSGLALGELAASLGFAVPRDLRHAKGWAGEMMEYALGASAGARPLPDFPELGIELKTLPVGANGRVRESTFVCVVTLADDAAPAWEVSLVRRKLARVLWAPIEADPRVPVHARRIGEAFLWSPSVAQSRVLQADYDEVMDLIAIGRLEEVSSRMGTCLQVRPKAADGRGQTRAAQADGAPGWTLPRGFYLRASFTTGILQARLASR